jgi:hypothetical protein
MTASTSILTSDKIPSVDPRLLYTFDQFCRKGWVTLSVLMMGVVPL